MLQKTWRRMGLCADRGGANSELLHQVRCTATSGTCCRLMYKMCVCVCVCVCVCDRLQCRQRCRLFTVWFSSVRPPYKSTSVFISSHHWTIILPTAEQVSLQDLRIYKTSTNPHKKNLLGTQNFRPDIIMTK